MNWPRELTALRSIVARPPTLAISSQRFFSKIYRWDVTPRSTMTRLHWDVGMTLNSTGTILTKCGRELRSLWECAGRDIRRPFQTTIASVITFPVCTTEYTHLAV